MQIKTTMDTTLPKLEWLFKNFSWEDVEKKELLYIVGI
jgi:hypothetical protein